MANPYVNYHVHRFKRYSQEITWALELYRKRTGIDCTVPDGQHPFHLNIISQINVAGTHSEIERKMLPFCRGLVGALGDALMSKHSVIRSGGYSVRLVNRDVNNDLWLMYQSPILLLTRSTFPDQIRSIRNTDDHKLTIHPGPWRLPLDPTLDLEMVKWRESHGFPRGHFDDAVLSLLNTELGFTP